MGKKRLHIEKNTIQETLVIPLYARKLCTELYPSLFKDSGAIALIDRLDYDFSMVEKQSAGLMQRFGALEVAMRQTDLAIEIQEYLQENPKAAIVNLGCGLDQTGENCDNGSCLIYNIDMPDVIEIRNQLIPPGKRQYNIACDLNDTTWFQKIDASGGAVFFASGVFYYFEIEDARKLINQMAAAFPSGKLVFDSAGKMALKMMLKTFIKQAGIKNVNAFFHIGSIEQDLNPWLKQAKASSKGYMLGYNNLKDPSISGFFRFLAHVGDFCMKMKIVRVDFDTVSQQAGS